MTVNRAGYHAVTVARLWGCNQGVWEAANLRRTVAQQVHVLGIGRRSSFPSPSGDRPVTECVKRLDRGLDQTDDQESSPAGIHGLGFPLIACPKRQDRDRVVEQL